MARKASVRTKAQKASTKSAFHKEGKKKVPRAVAKRSPKASTPKRAKLPKADVFDLSGFPPEALVSRKLGLCLACALDVLTRHMGLSAQRAQAQIRRYQPSLEEVSTVAPARPYFNLPADECPYCAAAPKWHAPLTIVRIEGGKKTDVLRRALLKKIAASADFTVLEEKSTERDALYDWLAKTGATLDLDSSGWLLAATRHWLARRLPEQDWDDTFNKIRFVRRSRKLEDEFETQGAGLFLAPALFDEVLLIQYLLSRSHKAGGQTFEGRLTLNELIQRLRGGGYLRRIGVQARNPSDALEQLVEILGGEGRVKFHYIVDRRDFLARLSDLKRARVPRLMSPPR
jgi:hypothetical protein